MKKKNPYKDYDDLQNIFRWMFFPFLLGGAIILLSPIIILFRYILWLTKVF